MVTVAIVGGGVNGLACALKIKEKYTNFQVTLISKEFSPNTTGDGSGGLWYPYLCGDTPEHLLSKWGDETYKYLHSLWMEGGYGVCFMPIYNLYIDKSNFHQVDWTHKVFGYQVLGSKELTYLSSLYSCDYSAGQTFMTFVAPTSRLLHHYYERFKELKGEIVQAEVTSLQDPILKPFQVVVNCTGLGAKYIVPDSQVHPIRGQVTRALAPWINETVISEDSGHYIIPNSETCVLGGTHQEHNYNTNIDAKDTDFVLSGCQSMMPGLKHAEIVRHWAGLRPGRCQVRLEEEFNGGRLYIHNYGHGGSGFTLFWGCATEVLLILEKHVKDTLMCKL